METPGISVIVPVHNGAAFYDAALDSIARQRWPDLEIIVIDDGSTDDLARRIEARGVPVRYLHQQQLGPAAARNRGLREAASDLIAFLDIDDQWTDGHLARLFEALREQPEAGFAQGLMRQFVLAPDGRCLMSGEYRMPYLGSCLFRRSVFDRCGMFDEQMKMGEDYDLVFRCWETDIPMQRVEEVSLLYRRHEGNMTRGKNKAANLGVLQRRMQRIRTGAVDPKEARRFAFDAYIGDTHSFGDGQLEPAETWNLSSAS
jgi:glycosyltransferase involved in cell wall biosynthesis